MKILDKNRGLLLMNPHEVILNKIYSGFGDSCQLENMHERHLGAKMGLDRFSFYISPTSFMDENHDLSISLHCDRIVLGSIQEGDWTTYSQFKSLKHSKETL
ncbi:hypothetical protein AVEN_4039-1 [Araneus ventricosus]|uniref:Uncharacterized protein n=1 Tax=Araneus ventricosus TaxID=182803 RepID=A0A4Y2J746_ARAVE|nr:hypothetical protein AVEN_4039-1 [Araneus ventricosus]